MPALPLLAFALTVLCDHAIAQPGMGPPGGGGGGGGASCSPNAALGQTASNICGNTTICSGSSSNFIAFGASAYVADANGRFTVNFTTNFCPQSANLSQVNGVSYASVARSACCTEINLPVAAYVNNAAVVASPLLGAIGWSMYGVNIYGPMEAGFTLGQACNNGKGTCSLGWDVGTCRDVLERQCGTGNLSLGVLLDDCGGHASPYHYHMLMHCEYAYKDSSGHSPLIGLMLDGRGLYGQFENHSLPNDLDACNGHTHPVPTTTKNGATFSASGDVYHYHVGPYPTTIGCFGPAATTMAAMSVYPSCSPTSITTLCTSNGSIDYMVNCPIGLDSLSFTSTPTCSACIGNCPPPGSGPSSGAFSLTTGVDNVIMAFSSLIFVRVAYREVGM